MRASTLLLVTWLIWITAKGRLSDYWKLATVSATPNGDGAPGENGSGSHASPDFPGLFPWLKDQIFSDQWSGPPTPDNTNGGGGF